MASFINLNKHSCVNKFICAVLPIKLSMFLVESMLKFMSIRWITCYDPRIESTISLSSLLSLLLESGYSILAECQPT